MEAGTEIGYGWFNREAAGLEGRKGQIWTVIQHDGLQSHDLGLGQVTRKSEGSMNWLYELACKRTCGSSALDKSF